MKLRHALAGLEAGTLGAVLMLLWLMLGSLLNRRSVWLTPNLFATVFYGPGAYRNAFTGASVPGVALIFGIYGSLGMFWGLVWRDEPRALLPFYGAAAGLAVYWLSMNVLWKQINPLMTIYAPTRQLQLAHILWGIAVARSSRYARQIADSA